MGVSKIEDETRPTGLDLTKTEGDGRRALVIVGMHRSGTSAVAGLCLHLGCDLPGDLIPPAFDNPKGFFESLQFVAFDDDILLKLGSAYDEPASLSDEQLQGVRSLGVTRQLADLISAQFGNSALVAIKDPRICRLLPIWIDALDMTGRDVSTLHPLRHPLEVAGSLQKRNGFSQTQGLLLWLDHVLAAERASRGRPRSFFLFDDLVQEWRTVATKISHDLSLAWPRSIARSEADIDGFLVGELRHHRAGEEVFTPGNALHDLTAKSWNAAKRLVADPSDKDAMAELDGVRTALDKGEAIYAGYISASQKLLTERFDRINALEHHAAHMDYLSSRSAAEAARLVEKIDAGEIALGISQSDLRDVESELKSTHQNLKEIQHVLRDAANEILGVRSELGRTLALRHEIENRLNVILGSVSWRLSLPVRVVGRSLPAVFRSALRRTVRVTYRLLTTGHLRPSRAPEVGISNGSESDASIQSVQPVSPEHRAIVQIIRSSSLFDVESYAGLAEAASQNTDPILHYVTIGERQGLAPSTKFDPMFYGARYPDVAASDINYLYHFILSGADEGRVGAPAASRMAFPDGSLDLQRKTVLVLAHEASRTGAPILAWNLVGKLRQRYNVIVLLMRGGEFTAAFEREADILVGPIGDPACFDAMEARFVVKTLVERYSFDFVIANSVETRNYATELAKCSIPVVALVHEFSTYYRPPGLLHELYESASKIVFPANVVRDVSRLEYEAMRKRSCEILPQGQSAVPPIGGTALGLSRSETKNPLDVDALRRRLRPEGFENAFLVLGMGTVQQRKGVDLFIAAADAARRLAPDRPFRFVWIGHGYEPDEDLQYSVYLQAQIELSGIGDCLDILGNVADLEPVYAEMDALLLSSRLDPLPNVSIDAALRGIPVVCFAGASGMADILTQNPNTRDLVVPHLDSGSAAGVLTALALDDEYLKRSQDAIREVAAQMFDMDTYVEHLERLGEDAIAEMRQLKEDRIAILSTADAFDRDFYTGEVLPDLDEEAALTHYLTQSSHRSPEGPQPYAYLRRPLPGFHPWRYAEARGNNSKPDQDPLARFLAEGRPRGPWCHDVIRPDVTPVSDGSTPRTAIHGHFHYPDLLPDFLARLNANRLETDLFLSTDSAEKAASLETMSKDYARGRVKISVVPNAGRDIAPFVTEFGPELAERYEIVGHLHGKRSLHTREVDATYGDRWREFLWEHLIGGRFPMADTIVARFAESPTLGLVFPEDPNLVGWDGSGEMARALAARMDIPTPLPASFDFPNGTMFWGRTKALTRLFDMGLGWGDYPVEPLAKDGTLLHAIERLVPFAVEASGYEIATTHVPGVVR